MRSLVLDTSALLALLFAETGADAAGAALRRSRPNLLSAVSYSEAMAKALDRKVPFETARDAIHALQLTLVPFDAAHALTAASLRPATRAFDFSFADRACLATAALAKAAVLTADQAWTKVDLGVTITLIR
jgi:PIN domain nuclease of toxin-antitoxin system